MLDSLLFAVRDAIRNANFGWDKLTCDIQDSGQPPPRCGDWFAAIHGGNIRSYQDDSLDERYGFSMTLTRRVSGVPIDRLGDQAICSQLARTLAKETGFNARAEQLRAFLHMNWGIIGDANTILVELEPQASLVYGWCEPARFRSYEFPRLVGGEWFAADPEADEVGLVSELGFEGARRIQAIASYI